MAAHGAFPTIGQPEIGLSLLTTRAPVSAKAPFDPTGFADEPADVLADALVERRLPRHELKANTVINHGEPSGGELSGTGKPTTDIFTGFSLTEAQPALGRHHTADAGDFGLLETTKQVLRRPDIRKPGPKSEEPFTAEEWRALLDRCVRANRDNLLDAIRQIVQGQPITQAAQEQIDRLLGFTDESRELWQSRIEPLPKDDPARFKRGFYEQSFELVGVEPTANLKELRDRLYKAGEVKLTGWGPFVYLDRAPIGPTPAGDAIEAWIGHPDEQGRDGRHSDFWRVNRAGCMYEIRSHDEDYTEKAVPGTAFELTMPIWRIGETLLYVARFAGCSEKIQKSHTASNIPGSKAGG